MEEILTTNGCIILNKHHRNKLSDRVNYQCRCGSKYWKGPDEIKSTRMSKNPNFLGCQICRSNQFKTIIERSGYTFVDGSWDNKEQKMKYICSCDRECVITGDYVLKGNITTCKFCFDNHKHPFEKVQQSFADKGHILLTTEYLNNRQKLLYRCVTCGDTHQTDFHSFQANRTACTIEAQSKKEETCMANYGVSHPSQSPEVQQRMRDTFMQIYGVENPMQHPDVQQKARDTCMSNYGVEYPAQHPDLLQKARDTCMQIYGVEHPMQHPDVQQKARDTCKDRYGVDHPMQDPEIFARQQASAFSTKPFTFPSGH